MIEKQKPDYKKLRQEARDLFVNKGKTQKEIAALLKVSSVTLVNWCKDGNWKSERDSRLNSASNRMENIRSIITCLSEQKLQVIADIVRAEAAGDREVVFELRRRSDGIADEVSKWNKSLQGMMDGEKRRITLSVYLDVMESVFKHMQLFDPALFASTLDFQEAHVVKVTKEIG